jgi:hypothetical protein
MKLILLTIIMLIGATILIISGFLPETSVKLVLCWLGAAIFELPIVTLVIWCIVACRRVKK